MKPRDIILLPVHLLVFLWRVLWSRTTPLRVRVLLVGYAVYLLFPFDIIPDFIVVAGQLDDLLGVLLLLQVIVNKDEGASDALWPGKPAAFAWLRRGLGLSVGWLPFMRSSRGIGQNRTR
jgi:uncharacterized membrane protein YkvA (DUF1232 family)